MTSPTVSCDGLGKRYRIGQLPGATTLRESLAGMLCRAPGGRQSEEGVRPARFIWAIRDISLEGRAGEAIGIVGRNGSGKSTLLKVLSRITAPTEGRAVVRGRVGSLLEVGTGFHPELTGRENIYLSGAIIGMNRSEINRKFDEIVAFSGVEKFLDTPVKRYSSGMFVRLGFSVSVHLEPEILFIDEVLAVGDVEFQAKCRNKMQDVIDGGGTILFVSHSMPAVKALCPRAILLDEGRIVAQGPVGDVISRYLSAGDTSQRGGMVLIPDHAPRVGSGGVRIRRVRLVGGNNEEAIGICLDEKLRLEIDVEVLVEPNPVAIELGLSGDDGTRIVTVFSVDREGDLFSLKSGWCRFAVEVDSVLLPRSYTVDVGIHEASGFTLDYVLSVLRFEVLNVAEDTHDRHIPNPTRGFVRPEAHWEGPKPIAAIDLQGGS